MLTDASIRVLGLVAVGLHLAAPLLGWGLGSCRLPVAIISLATAVTVLGLLAVERPGWELQIIAFGALQVVLAAAAVCWLLLPASGLAAAGGWTAYGLGLLWLLLLTAFVLFFRLNRLW